MISAWDLPTCAEIDGTSYNLHTDYRDILGIIEVLTGEGDEQENAYIALALFFEDFFEMPTAIYKEAWKYLYSFIALFQPESGTSQPKLVDWGKDFTMIAAGVNTLLGKEIRSVEYMHWFTFVGYYTSIGDCTFATVVSIRNKKKKGKKLDEQELTFYKENKELVDLPKNYTQEEQEEIERLNKLLG